MVREHDCLNGHEFGQTLEDGGGQGSLVCCRPQGHTESDTTWQVSNNDKEETEARRTLSPSRKEGSHHGAALTSTTIPDFQPQNSASR